MKDVAKCPFAARDCFAYEFNTRGCNALENTIFHPLHGCRFYKTKKQNDAEVKAAKLRNERMKSNE